LAENALIFFQSLTKIQTVNSCYDIMQCNASIVLQSQKQTKVFMFSADHLLLTVYPAEQKSCSHGTDIAIYSPLIVM